MPSPIFISRPSAGFSLISVMRGFQLTILGTYRALKNPELAKHGYYKKAITSIGISIIVQLLLWLPLLILKWSLEFTSYISGTSNEHTTTVIETLTFLQNNVFNVGPLLISGVRFFKPEMDDLFLMSLKFADKVYKTKHPESDNEYYSTLIDSGKHFHGIHGSIRRKSSLIEKISKRLIKLTDGTTTPINDVSKESSPSGTPPPLPAIPLSSTTSSSNPFVDFLSSYIHRSAITLAALILSHVPVVGPLVLPLLSFYSFNKVVGTEASLAVFAVGFMVPRKVMIIFLSSFWGSRSLVRELLIPYFSRIPFSKSQKARWFSNREGIMFGFGAGFYLFMRIPFIGVLVYGLAEASTAYLITKVSDPPPAQPVKVPDWVEHQSIWTANDVTLSREIQTDGFSDDTFSAVPGGWSS